MKHIKLFENFLDNAPVKHFILYNGNYYTIGGRRRMFWHFYNHVDPTVWIMEL